MTAHVKYLHSAMPGAPVLKGAAGDLINLLDACLVNGWGVTNVTALVIAGNVATATTAAPPPFEVGTAVLIEGATPIGINGEWPVTAVSATGFTFATTMLSDQTAGGTITAKVAPAGWLKLFTGTNLAAYQSADTLSTQCVLRIDDTSDIDARAVGYEAMTDISSGTGQFPSSSQISGGVHWTKSDHDTATAKPWLLVADGKTLHLAISYRSADFNDCDFHHFGDFAPTGADPMPCLIVGRRDTGNGRVPGRDDSAHLAISTFDANNGIFTARGTVSTSPQRCQLFYAAPVAPSGYPCASGSTTNAMPYPNPADGGLYLVPQGILESNRSLRGHIRGWYASPQSVGPNTFANHGTVTGGAGLADRQLRAYRMGGDDHGPNFVGPVFFDATGPW